VGILSVQVQRFPWSFWSTEKERITVASDVAGDLCGRCTHD